MVICGVIKSLFFWMQMNLHYDPFHKHKPACSSLVTEVVTPEIYRNMINLICMYIPYAQGYKNIFLLWVENSRREKSL